MIVPPHTKYLCGHLDSCTNPKKDVLVTSAVWWLAVVGAGVRLEHVLRAETISSGDDFERSWSGVRPELERRKSVVGQEEDVDDLLF